MKEQHEFKSVFANEFTGYLSLRKNRGHRHTREFHYFTTLDRYLIENNIIVKVLTPEIVEGWLQSLPKNMSVNTKNVYISHYTQFAKYLGTLGITAFIPERSVDDKSYVPYMFSADEISRLFTAADNVVLNTNQQHFADIDFPMILRLLYGCGLRLNEALRLRIADVDLKSDVLFVRNAKGNKDRLVPMDESLAEIIRAFISARHGVTSPESYIFPNRKGEPRSDVVFRIWFNSALEKAGIVKLNLPRNSRNICPHCIRHTFAVTSFRNRERTDVDMYAAAPYLSTYMGHVKIYGTEMYLHMTAENSEDIINQTTAYSKGLFPEVPR